MLTHSLPFHLSTAELNDFDDPLNNQATSSRAPLTGNIGSSTTSGGAAASSSSSRRPLNENYLTSRIGGEDRAAAQNTIDESVWDTLRRDLLAVWSKMREVLYPRYLFGGTMFESSEGIRGAYANMRSAGISGTREELAGLAGRVMDPENLLNQSNMTPGLSDWDLWGPLIFCLLLSLLLSFNASASQKDLVFSGVFAMVWIGEAVVTLQIKLLGGNMSVNPRLSLIVSFVPPLASPSCLFSGTWLTRLIHNTAHLHKAYASLATRCSRSSSPLSFRHSTSTGSPGSPSIWCSSAGLWRPASASSVAAASSITESALLSIHCSSFTWDWDVSASSATRHSRTKSVVIGWRWSIPSSWDFDEKDGGYDLTCRRIKPCTISVFVSAHRDFVPKEMETVRGRKILEHRVVLYFVLNLDFFFCSSLHETINPV